MSKENNIKTIRNLLSLLENVKDQDLDIKAKIIADVVVDTLKSEPSLRKFN